SRARGRYGRPRYARLTPWARSCFACNKVCRHRVETGRIRNTPHVGVAFKYSLHSKLRESRMGLYCLRVVLQTTGVAPLLLPASPAAGLIAAVNRGVVAAPYPRKESFETSRQHSLRSSHDQPWGRSADPCSPACARQRIQFSPGKLLAVSQTGEMGS